MTYSHRPHYILIFTGKDYDNRIDNLQNYCLGTRYGARSRSRLCRRLSISLVRCRHGLEKFLEHHFIPVRRRFDLHDLPTDLLRVQDPFFRGRRLIFSTENDGAWPAMGTPSMAWHVLFLCGRSSLIRFESCEHLFFLILLSRKSVFYKYNPNAAKTKRSCLRCIARLVCRSHHQVS